MSAVRKLGRGVATVFSPGPQPPPLADADAQLRLKARMGVIVQFVIANALLYLVLRKNAAFDHAAVNRFFAYVGATLLVDGLLSLAFMRRPGPSLRASLVFCAVLEMASIVVWIWVTGLASSYFCLAPMIFIALYRSLYDHSVALAGFLTAFVGLLAAQHLQRAGILHVAPLLADPSIGSYATHAYEDATLPNVLILLILTFAGTNIAAHQAVLQARALAEARAEVERLGGGDGKD